MKPEGFRIVHEALEAHPEIDDFIVRPEPETGEDVPEVEISFSGAGSRPLMNALGAAGLLPVSKKPSEIPGAPLLAFNFLAATKNSDVDKTRVTMRFRDRKAL